MFYLIIAVLIVLYYFFRAPDTIKSTMKAIMIVGTVAILLVLSLMSFMKLMQSPPELFVGAGMLLVSYLTLKDISKLEKKTRRK